jgi:resuscitation-promoting factor RpfB
MKNVLLGLCSLCLCLLVLTACQAQPTEVAMLVYVQVDNVERTFSVGESMTVEEFLSQTGVNIEWDENDRLVPPPYTQITDGTRITIVRVDEEEICETEEIPFEVEIIRNESLAPDDERVTRSGQNGVQRRCFRVIIENNVQRDRIPVGQPEVITEPVNEIRVVGINQAVEPFAITGTIAYINNGNAWVIRRNSTEKRPLTTTSDLDSMVLALSPDGQHIIYTREPADTESFVNELWLTNTVNEPIPLRLTATDVLYAEWVVNQPTTISYSTGEILDLAPGWDALNNLWLERLDVNTGASLSIRQIVGESSGGSLGWWGTVYKWSPDGENLAWVQADATGIFGEDDERVPLLNYPVVRLLENWSWRANVSWSWDGTLLATTVHTPVPNVPADTSPVFDVVVTDIRGSFQAYIVESAGMWSSPQFSPPLQNPDSQYENGYLAYLKSRDPVNTVYGEYDLFVADRDGSNARSVFPPEGQPGITWETADAGLIPQLYAWSPDARQIAVIYQGNLWVVDVLSLVAHQLTFDGRSQHPVWTQ